MIGQDRIRIYRILALKPYVGMGFAPIDSNIVHSQHIWRREADRPPVSFFADAQNDKQVFSISAAFSSTLVMPLDEYVGINGLAPPSNSETSRRFHVSIRPFKIRY